MSETDPPQKDVPLSTDDCPLPIGSQRRNIFCFGALWGLYYLAAPITYVGITHAYILNAFKTSDFVANLPSSVYMWMAALPILVAWFFPQPKLAKPIVVCCLFCMATFSGIVALALWTQVSRELSIALIVAHGVVLGAGNGLMYPAVWEMLRRGVSSSRRGAVMGLAFGAGPVLACVGSIIQQIVLYGGFLGFEMKPIDFPNNCALLFGIFAPVLLVIMTVAASFVVPEAPAEEGAATRVSEIVQGAKEFVSTKPVLIGVICYVLVYAGGNSIMQTVSLDAPEKIAAGETAPESRPEPKPSEEGEKKAISKPQGTVGYQNLLRFGFKAIAGVLLGWLLARTDPKAALFATTSTLVVAMGWALMVTGKPYLISLGLLGAGELFGAYFPNYVVSASRKRRVRLNVAYLTLISALVGFAPILFGAIADRWGRQASMIVSVGMLLFTMGIIAIGLPRDPRPLEDAEDDPESPAALDARLEAEARTGSEAT